MTHDEAIRIAWASKALLEEQRRRTALVRLIPFCREASTGHVSGGNCPRCEEVRQAEKLHRYSDAECKWRLSEWRRAVDAAR